MKGPPTWTVSESSCSNCSDRSPTGSLTASPTGSPRTCPICPIWMIRSSRNSLTCPTFQNRSSTSSTARSAPSPFSAESSGANGDHERSSRPNHRRRSQGARLHPQRMPGDHVHLLPRVRLERHHLGPDPHHLRHCPTGRLLPTPLRRCRSPNQRLLRQARRVARQTRCQHRYMAEHLLDAAGPQLAQR
ncbi:hypothetical protein Henu3_gp54 [Mycobacterium phage Henu3 PeY-2017]|nr:hypothetical protein Henu3_gp54 [Mycobacterium phage Henu3 PeY-2017]